MQSSTDTNKVLRSAVKNRLIRAKKLTKQEYVHTLNKLFVHRLEIGYRQNAYLQLQQRHILEVEHFGMSSKICFEQAQNLEKFVAQDYKKSMDLLKASDQLKLQIEGQGYKYLNVASKVYIIRCEINTLDARYRVLKQYHRFLFMISPTRWREQFAGSSQIGGSEISSNSEVQNHSFTNIANYVYNDLTLHSKPQLYFKNATEIENVFTLMEDQNYNYYRYLGHISSQSKKLNSCMRAIEDNIHYEHSLIQNTMEYFKQCIQYGIEKANGLRDIFISNIYGNANIFDLVCSKKVFKLITAVEYCYETVMEEDCGSFPILDMIKELEIDFLNNCRYLESFDSEIISKHVKDSYSSDIRKMKRAVIADKELNNLMILKKHMCMIMDPPVRPGRTERKRLYIPTKKKKTKKGVEPNTYLSPSDVQYLTLFTDWTKNEDPKTFLAKKKYPLLIS